MKAADIVCELRAFPQAAFHGVLLPVLLRRPGWPVAVLPRESPRYATDARVPAGATHATLG